MCCFTWTEPKNHWENPLPRPDNGFCQYPNHLRWNIRNVSHQSLDHPTPDGNKKAWPGIGHTFVQWVSLFCGFNVLPSTFSFSAHILLSYIKMGFGFEMNSPERVLSQFQHLSLCIWKLCRLHQKVLPQRCLIQIFTGWCLILQSFTIHVHFSLLCLGSDWTNRNNYVNLRIRLDPDPLCCWRSSQTWSHRSHSDEWVEPDHPSVRKGSDTRKQLHQSLLYGQRNSERLLWGLSSCEHRQNDTQLMWLAINIKLYTVIMAQYAFFYLQLSLHLYAQEK